jgi:Protein of unknown function (DUF3102)
MNKLVTIKEGPQTISRPLKVLVPLIQGELQLGHEAGYDHYVKAGEMLIEARGQVAKGRWTRWLTENFELSSRTAGAYIGWAEHHDEVARGASGTKFQSMREMRGDTERQREQRQSKQQRAFRKAMHDVARDDFVQARQTRDEEAKLLRELAVELIDIGFRALATRLHPDRGGSQTAMARLNRVRDELKTFAQKRRFS